MASSRSVHAERKSALCESGRATKEIQQLTSDGVKEREDETFSGGVEDEVDGMIVVSCVTVQIEQKEKEKKSMSRLVEVGEEQSERVETSAERLR